MERMKTFAIYLLLFIGLFIVSNLLISAYIKTSYYNINSYEIKEDALTVTIMTAKASKDDGYIEGKILNGTDEKITNKYMKVELFSENDVSLGQEYVKIEEINSQELKNFKINFSCDNVKHFIITFLTNEERESERPEELQIYQFETNEQVNNIITKLEKNYR